MSLVSAGLDGGREASVVVDACDVSLRLSAVGMSDTACCNGEVFQTFSNDRVCDIHAYVYAVCVDVFLYPHVTLHVIVDNVDLAL